MGSRSRRRCTWGVGLELSGTASRVEIVILACMEVTEFVQARKFLSSLARRWELVPVEKHMGLVLEWRSAKGGTGARVAGLRQSALWKLARNEAGTCAFYKIDKQFPDNQP